MYSVSTFYVHSGIEMTPLCLILLLLALKVWSRIENSGMLVDQVLRNYIFLSLLPSSLILDQCCYFYASTPRNDSNCIPEGDQLPLNCIIHNPRKAFTNLSVRWFRSRDMSADAEDIADIQHRIHVL